MAQDYRHNGLSMNTLKVGAKSGLQGAVGVGAKLIEQAITEKKTKKKILSGVENKNYRMGPKEQIGIMAGT